MLRPEKLVEGVRKRLRKSLIVREVCRYTTYAAGIALLLLVISKFIHSLNLWQIPAGILAFGILFGFFTAIRRKITILDAAMVADLRGDTGEVLTAYLELAKNPSAFQHLIEEKAEKSSRELNPSTIIPYRAPRNVRFLIPLLILVMGTAFMPEFKYPAQKKQEQNRIELAESAKKLNKASKIISETKKEDPQIKELQNALKELQAKIKRGEIDRKKAMAEMKKISDKLETLLKQEFSKKAEAENAAETLSKNEDTKGIGEAVKKGDKKGIEEKTSELAKKLDEMQKELKSEDAATRETAQKRIEDLRKTLETTKKSGEGGEKMSEELQKALDALSKMPTGVSTEGLSKEMLDELAKNMSKNLQDMLDAGNLSKEDLEKMMEAFKQMADAEEDARCGKSGEG